MIKDGIEVIYHAPVAVVEPDGSPKVRTFGIKYTLSKAYLEKQDWMEWFTLYHDACLLSIRRRIYEIEVNEKRAVSYENAYRTITGPDVDMVMVPGINLFQVCLLPKVLRDPPLSRDELDDIAAGKPAEVAKVWWKKNSEEYLKNTELTAIQIIPA